MKNISYHAHHSAFGTFSSFVMGKIGKGGGFVLNDVKPGISNIYIGYKRKGESAFMLPFFQHKEDTFNIEFGLGNTAEKKIVKKLEIFKEEEITRNLNWASDSWKAGDIEFKLFTPFPAFESLETLSVEELKSILAPAVLAELAFDNTKSDKAAEVTFGMAGMRRLLSHTTDMKLLGAANGTSYGFACEWEQGIREFTGRNLLENVFKEDIHRAKMGGECAIVAEVPANTKRTIRIALGIYQDGTITSGIPATFAYSKHFQCLEDVLDYTVKKQDYYIDRAGKLDEEMDNSSTNAYRKFLIAQATHSYHASSELLTDKEGKYFWIVNEGEYKMINTFDLTIDHLFWEMKFHPWTIKNALNLFAERYSYIDEVRDTEGKYHPGGISFVHDMGVANMFSPKGYSSYERPNIEAVGAYMTAEQLTNWVLCGSVYALNNHDTEWLHSRKQTFVDCFNSLVARDTSGNGIIDTDSSRCEAASEITTYDSLDLSLGQARNNLYLAVKTWASYVCLEAVFKKLELNSFSKKCGEKAALICEALIQKFDKEEGYIPAVFELGNKSRIIPAIEGLVYPFIIKDFDAVSESGRYSRLIKVLKEHFVNVLKKGICIDEVSGGWKLSSTSTNTWMSKIFLCQFAAEEVLKINFSKEELEEWDRVHAEWQSVGCSELCAVDQINSDTGTDRGSRLYPRLVTNVLWLKNN